MFTKCLFFLFVIFCTADQLRLVEIYPFEDKPSYQLYVTDKYIEEVLMARTDIKFADITNITVIPTPKFINYPSGPQHIEKVKALNAKVQKEQIKSYLEKLCSFPHRRSSRAGSEKSTEWIKEVADEIIKKLPSDRQKLFKTELVETRGYVAKNVIITMSGDGNLKDQNVIIGGHADDVGHPQAGADDDGSGTVAVMESFRVIAQSNFLPKRTLVWMLYTAEESGLIGSRQIASAWRTQGKKVHAVLQNDMNGYNRPGSALEGYVVNVQTHAGLTQFLRTLIKEYSGIPIRDYNRGYGSDHISWTQSGYPSSCWKEYYFSPQYHSTADKPQHINYDLIKEFAKVCVAFGAELSL